MKLTQKRMHNSIVFFYECRWICINFNNFALNPPSAYTLHQLCYRCAWSAGTMLIKNFHDDVIEWKHCPRYWPLYLGNPPVTDGFLSQKTSDVELWCFLWSAPEQMVEQRIETLVIWDASALIMPSLRCHYERYNSSALAMELLQPCTKLSNCFLQVFSPITQFRAIDDLEFHGYQKLSESSMKSAPMSQPFEILTLEYRFHGRVLFISFAHLMMTSSNGNFFRVTGPLCGEFTGHRWIPLTKTSDAELRCFLWPAPERTVE